MDLNVDVIDNETGEIYREGVGIDAARDFITKEKGKIVRDEVDNVDLDDIDGGGQMEVRSIFVDFPEEKLKRELSAAAIVKARDFWQYESGGGQVNRWSDEKVSEFANQLLGATTKFEV